MPISPPPGGIPQVPHGLFYKPAQRANKPKVRVAVLPAVGNASAIGRAILLSGLASSALAYFGIVTGDVENDIDDLVDEIQRWLRDTRNIGFSRGNKPNRDPREFGLPIPIKPSSKQSPRAVDEAQPEPDGDRRDKRDRDRPDPQFGFWSWLERRYGKPPKYNLGRTQQRYGIPQL